MLCRGKFDRSIIDALNYFVQHDLAVPPEVCKAVETHRYHKNAAMA